jgi:hypothetical protein
METQNCTLKSLTIVKILFGPLIICMAFVGVSAQVNVRLVTDEADVSAIGESYFPLLTGGCEIQSPVR